LFVRKVRKVSVPKQIFDGDVLAGSVERLRLNDDWWGRVFRAMGRSYVRHLVPGAEVGTISEVPVGRYCPEGQLS
jgi:hypothetical protein